MIIVISMKKLLILTLERELSLSCELALAEHYGLLHYTYTHLSKEKKSRTLGVQGRTLKLLRIIPLQPWMFNATYRGGIKGPGGRRGKGICAPESLMRGGRGRWTARGEAVLPLRPWMLHPTIRPWKLTSTVHPWKLSPSIRPCNK